MNIHNIIAVDTGLNEFRIAGNLVGRLPLLSRFQVQNSTGNNGLYTVTSISYDTINDETVIEPTETIVSGIVDGQIKDGTYDIDFTDPTLLSVESIIGTDDFSIVGIDQTFKQFILSGNVVNRFILGTQLQVIGSTGNDGVYTINTLTYNIGPNETIIEVIEPIPSTTADGSIRSKTIFRLNGYRVNRINQINPPDTVEIINSTGNDGLYTINNVFYDGGVDETVIIINEELPLITTVDGDLSYTSNRQFSIAPFELEELQTSIGLPGRQRTDYGETIAEDFVHLLEHFAAPTAPLYPTIGQAWFDTFNDSLGYERIFKLWDGTKWDIPVINSIRSGSTNLTIPPFDGDIEATVRSDLKFIVNDDGIVMQNGHDISLSDGTPASPSLKFLNSDQTGIFLENTNSLSITTASVEKVNVNPTGDVTIKVGDLFVNKGNGYVLQLTDNELIFDRDANTSFLTQHGIDGKIQIRGSNVSQSDTPIVDFYTGAVGESRTEFLNGAVRFNYDHTTSTISGNTAIFAFPHSAVISNYDNTSDTNISTLGWSIGTTGAASNGVIAGISTGQGDFDFAFYNENANTISESMRIISTGDVAIGSTSSNGKSLYIERTNNAQLEVKSSASGYAEIQSTGSSTNTNNPSLDGGGRLVLQNTSATNTNYSNIANLNSSGTENAGIAFNNDNHGTNAGSISLLTRAPSGSITEKMRITPAGDIGFEVSAPETYAGPSRRMVIGNGSSTGTGIFLRSGNTGHSFVAFADNAGSDGSGSRDGLIYYDQSSRSMEFHTAEEARLSINSIGNLTLNTGRILSIQGSDDAPTYSFAVDDDTGMFQPSLNNLAFSTGGNEALRINSLSDVGIGGITVPAARLHVADGLSGAGSFPTATTLLVESNTSSALTIACPNNQTGGVYFTNPSDTAAARIEWDYSAGLFNIGSSVSSGGEVTISSGNNVEAVRIDNLQRVGIQTNNPEGTLHIYNGNAGVAPNANASELVIEDDTNAGINILSGSSNLGVIYFGDAGDNNRGGITYDHSSDQLRFRVSALDRVQVSSSALQFLNGTALQLDTGTAGAPSIASVADPNSGIYFGTDEVNISTNNIQRVHIDDSGLETISNNINGGITISGASNPSLTLNDTSTAAYARILTSNEGSLALFADPTNSVASSSIVLNVDNSNRLILNSSIADFSVPLDLNDNDISNVGSLNVDSLTVRNATSGSASTVSSITVDALGTNGVTLTMDGTTDRFTIQNTDPLGAIQLEAFVVRFNGAVDVSDSLRISSGSTITSINNITQMYAGKFDANVPNTDPAFHVLPTGWDIISIGEHQYRLIHNLSTTNYAIVFSCVDLNNNGTPNQTIIANYYNKGNNAVDIVVAGSGSGGGTFQGDPSLEVSFNLTVLD